MAITVTIVGSLDKVLEDRLRGVGIHPTSVEMAELSALAHPSSTPPDVVILDLRAQAEIPPILGALKRQHPDTGLIVVTSTLDPAVMLEAMRAGVTECITDIERGDLEAAVARLVAQRLSPVAGEVFVFVGAKGGVGTTTAVVNIATTLSTIGSTLILDLHPAGGDAALFLAAEPRFSIIDALENTHRLDDAFFRGLVTHTKAGPDLLASADRAPLVPVAPPRVRALIDFVASHYRYVVIDIPRSDAAILDALDGASSIVVVANQELATIRSAARISAALRQRYGKGKVALVVNRPDDETEINLDDLQTAIGGRIQHVFPSDYRLAIGAINRGQPLVLEEKTPLGSAFKAYARELSGVKMDPEAATGKAPSRLLGRLMGRR